MKRYLTLAGLSLLGGLAAHVGVFFIFNIEGPSLPSEPGETVALFYVGDLGVGTNPVLQQQSLLYDSAPLFMPTRWNLVSDLTGIGSLNEATEVFEVYPSALMLEAYSLNPGTFNKDIPSSTEMAVPDGPAFYLSRFGRSPLSLPGLANTRPTVSAIRMDSADSMETVSLPLPRELDVLNPGALWSPIQFQLHLVEGKPAGSPMLAQGSGFLEWDQILQAYVGSLPFYRNLESGYYKITVFP